MGRALNSPLCLYLMSVMFPINGNFCILPFAAFTIPMIEKIAPMPNVSPLNANAGSAADIPTDTKIAVTITDTICSATDRMHSKRKSTSP